MKTWTAAHIELLREHYPVGGSERCSQFLHFTCKAISAKAQRLQIKGPIKTRPINDKFFDNLSTERSSYWLGFLYADGYHLPERHRVSIVLSRKDAQHLIKLSIELFGRDTTRTITNKAHLIKNKQCPETFGISLSFGNKTISDKLVQYGLTSKKSATHNFPNVPVDSLFHFIRGYFDGDGCFSKQNGNCARVKICASLDFAQALQELLKTFNIESKIYYQPGIYTLIINRKGCVKNFADLLYKDASIFLERKRDKYLAVLAIMDKVDARPKSSRFKGVFFNKQRKTWCCSVWEAPKNKLLGSFATEDSARMCLQAYLASHKHTTAHQYNARD